jgi:pyrroloquinoline quinone (PQQ) biosynthesis protein C
MFLEELRREIESHPAVHHVFLERCSTSPFAKQDYRIFGENHYPLVCVFTSYLERLLLRAPASDAKMWIAKVLVDEYGEGSDGQDHAALYAQFLRAAGSDVDALSGTPVPDPAWAFIEEHRRIVMEEPFLVGLGSIGPGHEWAIPHMFGHVIPGLRRAGFDEVEMQYFTLHVAQDEDHGRWLEEALALHARTADARAQIRRGAMLSLGAREKFWSGVQRAVVRWRQPRAVRPDGSRPRSTLHELALTAWDGSDLLRGIGANVVRLRDRSRPTLSGMIAEGRR